MSRDHSMTFIAKLDRDLKALSKQGRLKEAMHILLTEHNTTLHASTYFHLLNACIAKNTLSEGKEIHSHINRTGAASIPHTFLPNTVIHMYDKCGSLPNARIVFNQITEPDVFSWNMIIAAYRRHGFPQQAFTLFRQMQPSGIHPDQFTFTSIVPVCTSVVSLNHGLQVHGKIVRYGFGSNVSVTTSLIDMYAKCGNMQKARELFDKMPSRDVVSWTAMVTGYAQNGFVDEALMLFKEMPQRNVVSWTAIIAGYAQIGLAEKALEFFKEMQLADVKPDSSTFASILPACGKLVALEQGMEIHQKITESSFLADVIVVNALIDMYAKCGSLNKASALFDKMHHRTVVSWNAMIAGYAVHSFDKFSLQIFELMKQSGANPNHLSFLCVLFACSHAGLVAEGCKYFKSMVETYEIMPRLGHYTRMVDLLGHAGNLEEALNFIIKMPVKPDAVTWRCLLGACRSSENIRLGEFVARLLFELYPTDSIPYAILSNIYAVAGRWADVQKLRKLMKDRGIKTMPECSWIEVHKIVHSFCEENKSHPQRMEIYANLEKLSWEMKSAGYIQDTRSVLNGVDEGEKEVLLEHHSEMLAISFGLLNTSPETIIRIVKNLRMDSKCHTATKFISKIVAREIVVRDADRFHHFKHGQCSCGDHW